MYYLYLKSLHIIFIICWFSGLFYVVRLFVYFAEAQEKNNIEKEILTRQYQIMVRRLWYVITFPSAIVATIAGGLMLVENPVLFKSAWMQIKLLFVVFLWLYHFLCHRYVKQVKRQKLRKSGSFMRIWNEGATLILFSVVFLVILKNAFNWIFGVLGLISLAVLLMLGIKIYKGIRNK